MSNDLQNEMETGEDIITLVDDDGEGHEFEIVDSTEMDGGNYVALVPIEDDSDDSGELVILKVMEEDGEEFLDTIEDEAEFDKVSAIFVKRLEDVFDFEE